MTIAQALPKSLDLKPYRSVLALLGLALLGLQLLLCSQVSSDDLRFSLLCAAAIAGLVWTRRGVLSLESDLPSTLAGGLLLGWVFCRIFVQTDALFATIAPLPCGIALALLASGRRGLGRYWREGIVLCGTVVTPFTETLALELGGLDLSPITAKSAAGFLRLTGWQATAHDVVVGTSTGWVLVSQGCSGLRTMYFLVGFAVITLLIFPLPGWLRKAAVVVGAAAIGFIVNGLRVALLVTLAAPEHRQAFAFWHIKQGTMVVEVTAVVAFLAFFSMLIPTRRSEARPSLP